MTMVWVGWKNLGLRALLALHPPISPLTLSAQRNCASWAVALLQEGGPRSPQGHVVALDNNNKLIL